MARRYRLDCSCYSIHERFSAVNPSTVISQNSPIFKSTKHAHDVLRWRNRNSPHQRMIYHESSFNLFSINQIFFFVVQKLTPLLGRESLGLSRKMSSSRLKSGFLSARTEFLISSRKSRSYTFFPSLFKGLHWPENIRKLVKKVK